MPVIFTTIAFEASLADGGLWLQKMPGLADLQIGGPWVEIDPRLGRRDDETVVVKKGASAFFGTNLSAILVSQGIDTVVLCGATTSGCVRATAVDLLQNGFPTLVPRECVGDRAQAPHDANLFDIQAKYADVVVLEDAIGYLAALPALASRGGPAMTVPFSFVDLCAAELELCGLREGETVAVLSQMDERQDYADAFMAAALAPRRDALPRAPARGLDVAPGRRRRLDRGRHAARLQPPGDRRAQAGRPRDRPDVPALLARADGDPGGGSAHAALRRAGRQPGPPLPHPRPAPPRRGQRGAAGQPRRASASRTPPAPT